MTSMRDQIARESAEAKKRRLITRDDDNVCEWNPTMNRDAMTGDVWHADAELSLGSWGKWHLCRSCAALPRFKRFKVRQPMKGNT